MKKKMLSLMLALVMVLTLLPVTVNAETTGVTGGCTWTLGDDGLLIISGPGAIGSNAFGDHADDILSVVIEEGVTTIGRSAFSGCSNLTSVTIPEGVKSIGSSAFRECSNLTSVTIPGSVISIGSSAFAGCTSLTDVAYLGTTEPATASKNAFSGTSVKKIKVPAEYESETFCGKAVERQGSSEQTETYTVNVVGGTADKTEYTAGETVTITANAAEEGKQFAGWKTEDGVTFADASAATTTFTMPAKDVTVTASFIAQHVCGNGELQPGQAATCEADGWEDYYQCSCDKLYEDEACTTPIESLEAWKTGAGKIATEGHNYGELIPAQDAVHTQTLLSAAVAEHYYCGVCETYFVDEDGVKVKTTLDELTGEMPAHDTDAWVNTDEEQHWKKCSVCGLEDTATAAAHDFDNDSDTTCDTCGYVRTVSGGTTGGTSSGSQQPSYPTYWPVVDETTTGADKTEDHYMVLCRKLNVRAGVGTDYAKIGSLSRGEIVHGKDMGNGWIEIEYESETAYISAQYAEELDVDCEKIVTVLCRKLNVRKGAGTSYGKLGSVSRGDALCVIAEKDGWYEVLHNGKTAWVSAQYAA